MSEPTIVIPYGDWLQEYREKEVSVSDDDEILDAVEQGLSAAQLARLVIVAREQGHAPDEIVPPNKLLLMAGGSKAIVNKITRRTVEFETESGKTYRTRAYVAEVPSLLHTNIEGPGIVNAARE